MKVIIIVNKNLHHEVLYTFNSVDQCYSWLYNSLPEFRHHATMTVINNKEKFRDLFAYSNTAKLWQPNLNLMAEYFTVVKLKS